MRIRELMTKDVQCCGPEDALSRAAQIMWDRDCGIVPVVDAEARVVAMITDRDICMATYTKNLAPSQVRVREVASTTVYSVGPDDTVEVAERVMQEQQIRRLPVVDALGHVLGIVSINDIAGNVHRNVLRKNALSGQTIAQTLASIGAQRTTEKKTPQATRANEGVAHALA